MKTITITLWEYIALKNKADQYDIEHPFVYSIFEQNIRLGQERAKKTTDKLAEARKVNDADLHRRFDI